MEEINSSERGESANLMRRFGRRFTDESIDALKVEDPQFFERLIPGMRPEHAARYAFAASQVKEMNLGNSPVIVDAATGQGYGTKIITDILPQAKVIGVDINPQTIRNAHRKYQDTGEYVQADVRLLPLAGKQADAVTMFEILEHLSPHDQIIFLNEARRIIKPNGRIIVSVPYPSSTYKDKSGKIHRSFGSGYHEYEPTAAEVREMIKSTGFNIIGEYGQVVVNRGTAKAVSYINRVVPIWGIYAWLPKRDHSVVPVNNNPNKASLINVFVAEPV